MSDLTNTMGNHNLQMLKNIMEVKKTNKS